MNDVACVILDYMRPHNMPAALEGISKQTVETDVYVIHQGNDRVYDGCFENIYLGINRCSGARFSALPLIRNPYVIFIDDDLCLEDENTFEIMVNGVKSFHHVGIVGVLLGNKENPYRSGKKVFSPANPIKVDVCLGLLTAAKTFEACELWCTNLPLIYSLQRDDSAMFIDNDDVILSYLYAAAGIGNYAVGTGKLPYRLLDYTSFALAGNKDHVKLRYETCRKLFAESGLMD